ncbi:MAG TPA: helix-hairpin-helix domain-containing protein [Burkholderiaceae bacterium]|nr:helix-hairpin-helix domain-containing protein [Burkholderiaceae bacterium]
MLKKMLVAVAVSCATLGSAWAAVDVNTADQAALETVRGVGPARAAAIIDARTKGGPFKDGADLATRVDGIGPKSVTKLEEAGLSYGKATPAAVAKKGAEKGTVQAKAKSEPKK